MTWVSGSVSWDDANADLNVFLRDANGTTVASNTETGSTRKFLSATAVEGGLWSVAIKVKQGAANFDALINPFGSPPPLGEAEFRSVGSEFAGAWQTFPFAVRPNEPLTIQVHFDDPSAEIYVFLRDEAGRFVGRSVDGAGSPIELQTISGNSGVWQASVRVVTGQTRYQVVVNPR